MPEKDQKTKKGKHIEDEVKEEKNVKKVSNKKNSTAKVKLTNTNRNNASKPISARAKKTTDAKIKTKPKKDRINNSVKKEVMESKEEAREEKQISEIISEQIKNANKMKETTKIQQKKQNIQKREVKKAKEAKEKFIQKMDTIKKLNPEEKKNTYKRVFISGILAILVTIYNIILNVEYLYVSSEIIVQELKIISIIFIILTIIIFEIAYKKDRSDYAINGIELLIISIITLVATYVQILYTDKFMIFITITMLAMAIYYIVKAICIFSRSKQKHNKNISDVKEIVEEKED